MPLADELVEEPTTELISNADIETTIYKTADTR
jgi:hypothetical protein